jgi:Domain of unknown function (DUF4105)
MRRSLFGIAPVRFGSCALSAVLAGCPALTGCAVVRPQTANQPAGVNLASYLTDVVPPTLELPDWQAPQLDLSFLDKAARKPSNDRNWVDEQRLLAKAEIDGEKVLVKNVRNAQFFSYRDCLVDHYDKTYDLSQIKTVDFVMVPFAGKRAIAHTLLSFGFAGGEHVGVSVEVRLEKGETYNSAVGLLGQFELMYVVADERDLLPVRPQYRGVDVLLYPTVATPAQARALFLDVMKRVNQLHDQPEFYDTFRNNCTTNIVRHINTLAPGRIPYDYRVLLPGYADSLAYDLGLIDNTLPFDEVRRRARITDRIVEYKDDPQFSARIRGEKWR